jgi:hypothetical protein
VTAGGSALVLALVDRATGEVAPHQPFGARDHNGPGRTGPVPDGVPFPAGDPPTKVSSKVFVWFPTSERMMLFAAEIGAVAGLMMGPYLAEPNRS